MDEIKKAMLRSRERKKKNTNTYNTFTNLRIYSTATKAGRACQARAAPNTGVINLIFCSTSSTSCGGGGGGSSPGGSSASNVNFVVGLPHPSEREVREDLLQVLGRRGQQGFRRGYPHHVRAELVTLAENPHHLFSMEEA